jgi:hypothetical protein
MPDIQTRKNHIARTDLINGTLMILRGKLLFAVAILLFYVCSQFVRLFSTAPLCSKPVSREIQISSSPVRGRATSTL